MCDSEWVDRFDEKQKTRMPSNIELTVRNQSTIVVICKIIVFPDIRCCKKLLYTEREGMTIDKVL
jgi:hypothetical protein